MNTLDKLQKAFPECYRKGNVLLINADCMDVMKLLDDKEFCFACVDPPYGIGESGGKNRRQKSKHAKKEWDNSRPDSFYFDELFRVSKHQIIWGANYFTKSLNPSMGWIAWDKKLDNSDFSDFELAFSSFERAAKIFRHSKNGGNPNAFFDVIHPCQKPIKLYEWLFENYAKKGQKVFDSHLGSASSAIAAHYFGVDFVGCELDKDYFDAAKARFDMATKQLAMSI